MDIDTERGTEGTIKKDVFESTMRTFSDRIHEKRIEHSVALNMLEGSFIPTEVIQFLNCPNADPEVMNMIRNVYEKYSPEICP